MSDQRVLVAVGDAGGAAVPARPGLRIQTIGGLAVERGGGLPTPVANGTSVDPG